MACQPQTGCVIDDEEEIVSPFASLKTALRSSLAFGMITLVLSALSYPCSVQAGSVAEGARAHVETLLDEGMKLLIDEELTSQEFVNGFRRLFREYFAVTSIGRWTLGRHWKKATPEQRQEYLSLFEDLVVLTQVNRFRKYTGGGLQVVRTVITAENSAIVFSEFVREQDKTPIGLNWRVGYKNGIYKITDVVVKGTSMSQTIRSDFGATIRRRGNSVARFLEDLGNKVSALKAELKTEG
jgi:phospholipid transport system substrate-binding protein